MTKEIPTAWAVLDMDGEAFHSVHIFKDDAERSSFGLGDVVALRVDKPAGPLKMFLVSALIHRSDDGGEIATHRAAVVWSSRSGEAVEVFIDAIEMEGYQIGEYECSEIPLSFLYGADDNGRVAWWAEGRGS